MRLKSIIAETANGGPTQPIEPMKPHFLSRAYGGAQQMLIRY